MDIVQVSAVAVAVLAEFFKGSITEVGKKMGDDLFEYMKKKFKGRKEAETALKDFQRWPTDELKRALLAEQIMIEMEKDITFASFISNWIDRVFQDKKEIFVNEIGSVNTLVQIGTMDGDINL